MKKRLKVTFNAPLALWFSLACTAVTLVGQLAGEKVNLRFFSTYAAPLGDPLTYVRLFTHVLGHADWTHLIGNLSFVLLLGPGLEEKYGWKNLLAVMLFTALVTGLVHNLIFPGTALLGASGIAFAMILLTSFTEFRQGEIPLTVILVALIYLGQQIWEGVTVRDNISNLPHIIGGAVGAGAGYLLNARAGRKKQSGQ